MALTPDQKLELEESLMEKYERLSKEQDFKFEQTQADAKKQSGIGTILDGVVGLANANNYARNGKSFDSKGGDILRQDADRSVSDAAAERKQAIESYLLKDKIGQEEKSRGWAVEDRAKADKQREFDNDYKNRELDYKNNLASANASLAQRNKFDKLDEKAEERAYKEEQRTKPLLNEIEDRRTNINQNLDLLDKMIEEDGTYEVFGSHNQDMDRLVDQIATDMAKLQDPSSVARPSEVEAVKKNLIKPGFNNTNSTARDIIKNFRSEVDNRANSAYKIRGVERPGAEQAKKIEVERASKDGRIGIFDAETKAFIRWKE